MGYFYLPSLTIVMMTLSVRSEAVEEGDIVIESKEKNYKEGKIVSGTKI